MPPSETIYRQAQGSRLSSRPHEGSPGNLISENSVLQNSKYLVRSASLNLSLTHKKNFRLGHGLVGLPENQLWLSSKGSWERG